MRPFASKVGQLLLTLLLISMITFLMLNALPGSAAANRLGPLPGYTPEQRQAIVATLTKQLGLDRPLYVQFWLWLKGVLHGDFGLTVQGLSVRNLIGSRIFATVELALVSTIVTVVSSVGLAIAAFRSRSRVVSASCSAIMSSLLVVPAFWLGLLLILLFAAKLGALPASGYVPPGDSLSDNLRHLILPMATLSVPQIALIFRYVYAGLQDNAVKPFILAGRARGLRERTIMYRSVLPNGILPSITIMGIVIGSMMSGLVVVETVFSWPGLGSLLVRAVNGKDINTVAAIVMITAAAFVLLALLVDLLYQVIDPRVRVAGRS